LINGTAPGLKELITGSMTSGMSAEKATEWATEFETKIGSASSWLETNWTNTTGPVADKIDGIISAINGLPEKLTDKAGENAVEGKKQKLEGAGFNRNSLASMSEESLDKLTTFTGREKSPETFNSRYTSL
jgi:hypothetical protein